ncbi:conserved hypothetical protein [Trichinella spiralis]|uniref:hypothetical protein n=1 Tax=Trichinella spiralis TaxID=6334 RepID=UPI0001EFE3AB|nr:conserved hypothetical protein [Trichinella spiralis]
MSLPQIPQQQVDLKHSEIASLNNKRYLDFNKSFHCTYSSLSKTRRDKNITPGTKTTLTQRQLHPLFFSTVNNGITIKRSKGQPHVIYLPQLRWSGYQTRSQVKKKRINKSEEGRGTTQARKLSSQALEPLLSYHFNISGALTSYLSIHCPRSVADTLQHETLEHRIERLQHLCGNGTDLVAIREATKAVEEVKQAFLESRRARQEELPEGDREKALAEYDHLMDLVTQLQNRANDLLQNSSMNPQPNVRILPIWRSPPTCQWSDNRDKNYEAVVRLLHDRFHRTTDILDAHISRLHEIRPRFGTTRSRFSLIGHYPRYFIGPSNLNHN